MGLKFRNPKFNIFCIIISRYFFIEFQPLRAKRSMKPFWKKSNPAGNRMVKVNNRNTRTRCEICSKLTLNIFHTLFFIVNFEQVIASWEVSKYDYASITQETKNIH